MDRFSIDRMEGNFVMVYKASFQDRNLSLKARGLLVTVMAFPSDWEFSINGLVKVLKEGKSSVYNTINELIELGYCKRENRHDTNGRMLGVEYCFAEYPKFVLGDACNPLPENRDTDNQPQCNTKKNKINNNLSKEEILAEKRAKFAEVCEKYVPQYGRDMVDRFIHYWCEADGCRLRCEIAKQKSGCFEIGRRLATWANKPYNNPTTTSYVTSESSQPQKPKKKIWEEMGLTKEQYENLMTR